MTEVLSPEGAAGRPADALAVRLPAFGSRVVALHDNAKPGASHLLAAVGEALGSAGAQLREWHKAHAARPSPHIAEMARAADAAVFALGDWGSCTSWSVHDAVEMERAGRPTVTIVSSAFELLARAESRSLGMAELPVLVVPHPVAPQPPDVLREWGEKLCPDVLDGLLAGDGRDG